MFIVGFNHDGEWVEMGRGDMLHNALCAAATALHDDAPVTCVVTATKLIGAAMQDGVAWEVKREVKYVVRYGTQMGSLGNGKLGEGGTVARAMQQALEHYNSTTTGPKATWEQMVTEYLATDWYVWVSKE